MMLTAQNQKFVDFNPFPVQTSLIFGPADCGFGKHAGRI